MKNKKPRIQIITSSLILITIISISGFVVYAMQSASIPVEVKEPLQILDLPTGFSLYPGETINFNFTVENSASVNYFQEFEFLVNDSSYQKYVGFSNHNYSIPNGIHTLKAWMTISPNAPPANFTITINKKTETSLPTQPPTNQDTTLNPTLELLAAGAKWTAQKGNKALFINWKDNYEIHHTTDGANWQWRTELKIDGWFNSITAALESASLEITFAGDIPADLSSYDVVVIYAYYAVEPHHSQLIKEYIQNGGSVVLIAGVPGYFVSYSKTLSCSTNLETIEEWFGASNYQNNYGPTRARVVFDNPLGTSLLTSDTIRYVNNGNVPVLANSAKAAVNSLLNNTTPIAYYDSGLVFAFTHEYGLGRVYYQAHIHVLDYLQP